MGLKVKGNLDEVAPYYAAVGKWTWDRLDELFDGFTVETAPTTSGRIQFDSLILIPINERATNGKDFYFAVFGADRRNDKLFAINKCVDSVVIRGKNLVNTVHRGGEIIELWVTTPEGRFVSLWLRTPVLTTVLVLDTDTGEVDV